MNKPSYTPGPWEIVPYSPYRVASVIERDGDDVRYGGYICDTANNKLNRTPENAANARLIAAAPEMAEALLALLKHDDTTAGRLAVKALQKAGLL